MADTSTYYTLRYQYGDTLHKAGERIAAMRDAVRIGQQEDCDVRLDNLTDYADDLFAVIKPGVDDGWVLIPCSDYVSTLVNGTAVQLMHRLADGDRICFSECDQELLFNICHDMKHDVGNGNVRIAAPMSRKLIAALVFVPLLLFGVLYWYIHDIDNKEECKRDLLKAVKSSVMQISVDSVYFCMIVNQDTAILKRYSYVALEGHAISGTAFATNDGLLVTARHCIEPWLNSNEALEKPIDSISSLPVMWALEAETYNQLHDSDTTYKVISLCELSNDQDDRLYGRLFSSDFEYSTDADDIIELGDFNQEYYWRSIMRRHAQTDMMMDDMASIAWGGGGTIELADTDNIESLVEVGAELYFMGYPNFYEKGLEQSKGKVSLPFSTDKTIAHNGNLVHGYSGGPALVVSNGKVYAVGVISVTDNNGGNRMYSVPVTELKKKGGKR